MSFNSSPSPPFGTLSLPQCKIMQERHHLNKQHYGHDGSIVNKTRDYSYMIWQFAESFPLAAVAAAAAASWYASVERAVVGDVVVVVVTTLLLPAAADTLAAFTCCCRMAQYWPKSHATLLDWYLVQRICAIKAVLMTP